MHIKTDETPKINNVNAIQKQQHECKHEIIECKYKTHSYGLKTLKLINALKFRVS